MRRRERFDLALFMFVWFGFGRDGFAQTSPFSFFFHSSFTGLEVYKQMFGMNSSGGGDWQEGNSVWEFSLGGRRAGAGGVVLVPLPGEG